jgi:multiple sugar transport system ATP-binding protein
MEDLPGGGAGQHVVARLDAASSASPGREVELTLDCTQIKLFDPHGGRSLLHPDNGAAATGGGSRAAGAAEATA